MLRRYGANGDQRGEAKFSKGGVVGKISEILKAKDAMDGLQTETKSLDNLSDVFGDFFGHDGIDDYKQIARSSASSSSFPFYAEFGSRLSVRRHLEGQLFSVGGIKEYLRSKKEIQKWKGMMECYVERFSLVSMRRFGSRRIKRF